MFQFLKRHIIKAISSLRRGGRRCHFGVGFQVGGESGRTFRRVRKMRNYAYNGSLLWRV
jgi:hypothetical protein